MSKLHTISSRASEDRLEALIRQRLLPGADKAHIDERIWDLFGEEWAVMFTDLCGFSRRVAEFGIIHFLQTIYESERLLVPIIEEYDGILLKVEGDSLLVIFRNPQKCLHCAVAMQSVLADYNQDHVDEEKVLLGVGLGFGRVLRIGDSDVFGTEVNAASKLGEDRAGAGDILVTGAFRALCSDSERVTGFTPYPDPPAGSPTAFQVHYQL